MKCLALCAVLAVSALAAASEVKECKLTAAGQEYKGVKTVTLSNKACQFWSSDEPWEHGWHRHEDFPEKDSKNYCRNPDKSSGGPWCFLADGSTRWEYCDVKMCDAPAAECDCTTQIAEQAAICDVELGALRDQMKKELQKMENAAAEAQLVADAALKEARKEVEAAKEELQGMKNAAAEAQSVADAALAEARKEVEAAKAAAAAAKEYEFYTSDVYGYHYIDNQGVDISNGYVRFQVKACNDVHVGLSTELTSESSTYEIVIGGWSNKKSIIRVNGHGTEPQFTMDDDDHRPLDCDGFRRFWVSWKNGVIKVGTGSFIGDGTFMQLADNSYKVNHLGISTGYYSDGLWKF